MENWERQLDHVQAPDSAVNSHRDALRDKLHRAAGRNRSRVRRSAVLVSLLLVLGLTGLTVAKPDWVEQLYRVIKVEEYLVKTDDGREIHIKTVEAEAGPNAAMGEWQTDASDGNIVYELQAGDPRYNELLDAGEKLDQVLQLEVEVTGDGGRGEREQQIMMMRTDDGNVWVINGDTVTSAEKIAALESHHGMIERIPEGESSLDAGDVLSTEVARDFELHQNYPNPFNPSTQISYDLKDAAQVSLTVYDLTGREVATLVNGMQAAGSHTVTFDGAGLPSGSYLYTLRSGDYSFTKKMVLMK